MAEARGDNCHVAWRSAIVMVAVGRRYMLSCHLRNYTSGFTSIKLGLRKRYDNAEVDTFCAISANSRTNEKYTSGDVFSVLWCNH